LTGSSLVVKIKSLSDFSEFRSVPCFEHTGRIERDDGLIRSFEARDWRHGSFASFASSAWNYSPRNRNFTQSSRRTQSQKMVLIWPSKSRVIISYVSIIAWFFADS